MKFIKVFENYFNNTFSESEFYGIKDIYIDLVDDLNLTDVNSEREMTRSMTSNIDYSYKDQSDKMSDKKSRIDINIRTASLDSYDDYGRYAISSTKDKDSYQKVMNVLQPFIKRMESMGYKVYKSDIDLKIDSWKYITGGIKISITK